MTLSHEELKSLIAPYALGAVSDEEMRVLRSHILSCEECMQEADSLTSAASLMTLAVEEAPLPSGFADRLLSKVEAERPAAVAHSGAPRRFSWRMALLSGAASLALAVAGGVALDARRDLERNRDALLALLHSDQGVHLQGQRGAVARLVPTADGSMLIATGLEAPPDDHTYQLWFIRGGKPVSGGTFGAGDGVVVLQTPDRLDGIDAAAVTVEPEGGSRAPTTDPVISSA